MSDPLGVLVPLHIFLLQVRGARAVLQLYPENSEQVSPWAGRGAGSGGGGELSCSSLACPPAAGK